MEARGSTALPCSRHAGYIGLTDTGEAIEAHVPEGYFQRRWHGKQSIKRQIRKFLITGWCKWRGRSIENRAELAREFDQQIVGEMERTAQPNRRNNAAPATMDQRGESLPDIIQQFSWCDVIVILGTRKSKHKAPKDGKVKGTGMRSQHDSQCARGYEGQDRMAGLLSNKRFNSNNITVRVKNLGNMDLFIARCYAYIQTTGEQNCGVMSQQ